MADILNMLKSRSWKLPKLGMGMMASAMLLAGGCEPPLPAVLADQEGVFIRQSAIDRVFENPDLTEAEQRQALRDLGITDESLIDLLIRSW